MICSSSLETRTSQGNQSYSVWNQQRYSSEVDHNYVTSSGSFTQYFTENISTITISTLVTTGRQIQV